MNFLHSLGNLLDGVLFKAKSWINKERTAKDKTIKQTLYGNINAITRRLNSLYPHRAFGVGKEYKDKLLCMQIDEGGEFSSMKYVHFSPCAVTGDIVALKPIRFYFKCIGFEDIRAPKRNWGVNFSKFRNFIFGIHPRESLCDL